MYIDAILKNLQDAQDAANKANDDRYKEALGIYDKIVAQFSEAGDFMQGVEAQIGIASKKSVAQGTQALVSSGLSNTTTRAGLAKKFEEEVGTPARLKANDTRIENLSQARTAKAGLIERASDTGPDPMSIANLAAQANKG